MTERRCWYLMYVSLFLFGFLALRQVFHPSNNPARSPVSYSMVETADFESRVHNFRHPNRLITEYDTYVAQKTKAFADRKAPASDPALVELARQMMDEPRFPRPKLSKGMLGTYQSKIIDEHLGGMKGGKFIECGGYDGEVSSPTVSFELRRGWTGLLVEADPGYYTQLLGKQRNVYSINACLSPYPYFSLMKFQFSVHRGTGGQLGKLAASNQTTTGNQTGLVPCFPLETLLLALDWTTIDFFSLDVEGMELPILRTIPFNKLNIRTLAVEYVHGKEGKQAYLNFMNKNGYSVLKEINFRDQNNEIYIRDILFAKDNKTGFYFVKKNNFFYSIRAEF